MTKEQALHNFFSGFGVKAYQSSAPSGESYPYITYELAIGAFGDIVPITASIWDYGTSEAWITATARDISQAVGLGGVRIPCDEGGIWVTRGTPWCQTVTDPDPLVKRRYLNFNIEFFTNN